MRLAILHSAAAGEPTIVALASLITRADADNPETRSVSIALTTNEEEGSEALNHLGPIDSLIVFGKTARSAGLDDLDEFTHRMVMLNGQVAPTNVLRLPSLLSSVWADPTTAEMAVAAIQILLQPSTSPAVELALPARLWN